MERSEELAEENRRLRRTMRDLVAFSTLPAVWGSLPPEAIARSLADTLRRTLALEFVYVRLSGLSQLVEVVSAEGRENAAALVTAAVAPLLDVERIQPARTLRDPFGNETLQAAVIRFGPSDAAGVVVAAARRGDFPTEHERLLLGVGANQTATVVERRRGEAQVRASAERLQALVSASSDVVYRVSPDWAEMRLVRGREFVADTHEPTSTWLEKYIHPEDQAHVRSVIQEAVQTRSVFELEHRVRRVDGSIGWTFSRAVPLLSPEGEIVEWFGAASDITERKRAEERLRVSEEKYRTLFDSMDEGFCIYEMIYDQAGQPVDYRFLEVNPAFERHTGLADAEGKTIRELVPNHEQRWFEIYSRVVETGVPVRVENRGEGMQRWFNVYAFRHGGPGSRKVAAIFTDVTDRTLMEQEREHLMERLRDADRRKDEFLATLAHELRNPLAPIRNAVQIMRMSNEPELQGEAQTVIERQLGQMVRLVDDLMDVSRISRDKLELKQERVDLAKVVQSAVETSRPLIDQMGHRLSVRLPPQPVYVDADPTRLAQVFLNLLNNSAKYTEAGGRIELTAERHGSDVVVSVRDNGIGIPAENLPSVFDLFSQVASGLYRSQGGLGIGLSLVRRLVEMHGGSITAESGGLGLGSTFAVRLPMVSQGSPPESPETEEAVATSKLRILIVDDNRDSTDSLAMMLKLMGNEIRTAYDGEQAVAVAEASRPDVILLDIGLPNMNGYEVCRRIRAAAGDRKLIVIAQTGWGQDEDRQRTQAAGFDYHLVKPVDPQSLMKLLTELQVTAG